MLFQVFVIGTSPCHVSSVGEKIVFLTHYFDT